MDYRWIRRHDVPRHFHGTPCYNPAGIEATPCMAYTTSSAGSIQGGWWVFSARDPLADVIGLPYPLSGLHYWWLTGHVGGNSAESAVLSPADAFAIDSKVDDGIPLRGNAFAAGDANHNDNFGPTPPSIGAGGPNSDTCVDNNYNPNTYNVRNPNRTTANLCSMIIRTSF
jgi:hypothetical protein